jgi:superfamily I DNA/RNA helicase
MTRLLAAMIHSHIEAEKSNARQQTLAEAAVQRDASVAEARAAAWKEGLAEGTNLMAAQLAEARSAGWQEGLAEGSRQAAARIADLEAHIEAEKSNARQQTLAEAAVQRDASVAEARAAAWKEGLAEGTNLMAAQLAEARSAGWQEGLAEGSRQAAARIADLEAQLKRRMAKQVWVIEDRRKRAVIQADRSLYGPRRLLIPEEIKAAMRADVAQLVASGALGPPTEEQWAMVFSDHPATCVIAAAGSGKSTTLVLRVALLVCYLGVALSEMKVISFTVKSCEELRRKLFQVLSAEPLRSRMPAGELEPLNQSLRSAVSTFHAALNRLAREIFSDITWFDVLDDGPKTSAESDDLDNPFAGQLGDQQIDLLREVYLAAFHGDAQFKHHLLELMRIETEKAAYRKEDDYERQYRYDTLRRSSQDDLGLVQRINARWAELKEAGEAPEWAMDGVDPTPFEVMRVEGFPFYANGQITATGRPILLSLNGMLGRLSLFAAEDTLPGGFPLRGALKVRRSIFATFYSGNALDVRGPAQLRRLELELRRNSPLLTAPRFFLQLDGEVVAVDILEALFAQGSFIENLGMEVPETLAKLPPFREYTAEHHFAALLAIFWPAFERLLAERKMMTFNRAFLLLTQTRDHLVRLERGALAPFTNLLIDEFQDISPQIVAWLLALQRRVLELGGEPTLMAIGDDWQSIYGWRGTTPDIFIRFGDHFLVHRELQTPDRYLMTINFRSTPSILRDSEKILSEVQFKTDKQARAHRLDGQDDHGVRLVQIDPDSAAGRGQIVQEIAAQLAYVESLPEADPNKVLVLARSNRILNEVRRLAQRRGLNRSRGVEFLTYHRAKGLQGEVAILCEDCEVPPTHPLRNAIYAESEIFRQSYDEAARDEAYRLAYVAVTRGIRRVVWFVKDPKGAAQLLSGPPE